MKLDVNALRYLTKSHFRVLTAIEMGMRNHELVPMTLIQSIAKVRTGGVHKLMADLLRNSLVHRDRSKYEGYRLTYMGYDYLALHTFVARGTITGLGRQIGIGKESDIYLAVDGEGRQMALKLHRLGRISFRNVRNKRDYMRNKGAKPGSWLYLSRLACIKEHEFMTCLYENKFPVPEPIDQNRHAILMSLCEGFPMTQVRHIAQPAEAYTELMELILRLARCGLIHGDFNEYNLILGYDEKITLIDFPQMISTRHPNAQIYFDRDCKGVADFFRSRLGYHGSEVPLFTDIGDRECNLDQEVQASGYSEEHKKTANEMEFDQLMLEQTKEEGGEGGEDGEDGEDGEMSGEMSGEGGEMGDQEKEDIVNMNKETKEELTRETTTETSSAPTALDVVSLVSTVSADKEDDEEDNDGSQSVDQDESKNVNSQSENNSSTSFLDQASQSLDKKETAVKTTKTTDETEKKIVTPTPKAAVVMSAAEIREKVRRSMSNKGKGKKGKKGGGKNSKSKKNENKNRDARRNLRIAKGKERSIYAD